VYHGKCIRAGPPFRTRLPNGRGLAYPSGVPVPHFICECCQVRALLNRELDRTHRDVALLMLERMRMIDVISNWRSTTLGQYAPALRALRAFEAWSGVPTLVATRLARPPTGPIYGIMYAQLRATLPKPGQEEGIKFNSSRKLRSAASMWYNLDMQLCYPEQATRDQHRRCYLTVRTSPSDALAYTFLNSGMARRMGDASQPSWTLAHCHIVYIDRRLEEFYATAERVSRTPREGEGVPVGWRKATPDEINEHGRWRTRYHSESMAVHYNEWEVIDRIMITLLCM
jgi:hypothetical protein